MEKNQENLEQCGQKEHFWPKMTTFWPKKAQKSKSINFGQNPKHHKSKFYGCPTSCKKPEKLIPRFLRGFASWTDGHTGHT